MAITVLLLLISSKSSTLLSPTLIGSWSGNVLILPSLSRETLLRKQGDGEYRLILGTFVRETEAEKTAQAARSKGYIATVIERRVAAGARSLYRVELEKLPDTAAVDRAWGLVDGSRS